MAECASYQRGAEKDAGVASRHKQRKAAGCCRNVGDVVAGKVGRTNTGPIGGEEGSLVLWPGLLGSFGGARRGTRLKGEEQMHFRRSRGGVGMAYVSD